MKNGIKRLYALCFDSQTELKTRVFRIIIILGEAACLLAAAANVILRADLRVTFCFLVGDLLLAVGFWLTVRLQDCKNLFTGMIMMVNMLLFPLSFLFAGGIDSGAPVWLIFGLMLVFMFLDGWRFWLALVCSAVSMIAVYVISALHPSLVRQMESQNRTLFVSCFSVLLVGALMGMIFYFQQRMYEKEREISEEQRRTIQQLSDSRNLFFANMSHEIRTPINTIIGLNEMTLRENISDEVAENAINIQNASKILLALINDILDLSKIESGKMEIVPARYETAALFSDLVNIIWIRAHEKKLDFHIDIEETIPSVLYGDEVRIRQILVNLLTNAVKYTQKGSVSLIVKGEPLENDRIRLKMSVRDTGIGIRSEDMEHLFTSYRRVDESSNRKIEGTGLGLSISRQLVEMMGGTITVDSIYTKGSVFTVALEQQVLSGEPLGLMQYAVKQSLKNRPKYERSFEAPEARVLIVDDNEMNRMVARKLLRDTRVQIDTASSGRECLQKTMEKEYHVIFMDHVMPEMDGEETLKALRSRNEGFCQKTPVIALTANVMSNAEEWYRERNFDGYLSKPINGKTLEAVLQRFLPDELLVYRAEEKEQENLGERISNLIFHENRRIGIRITTDCVCDLPEDLLKQYGIGKMYYYVTTQEGRFRDGTEISTENLLDYMNREKDARSEPASEQEYERFFAHHLTEAEHVIHISMASRTSEGYAVALRAAKGFDNVEVLDSRHLSSGLGLIVLQAAKLARNGADAAQICRAVEQWKTKTVTGFLVASSENLYRSGRISRNAYLLGRVLQLHPVLIMKHGRILASRIYAGSLDTASKHYVRSALRRRERIDDSILFITYAGCSMARMSKIRAEAQRCMPFQEVRLQEASPSIASNCGAGAFGIIFMKK